MGRWYKRTAWVPSHARSFGHVQRFIKSKVLRVSKSRHIPFVIAATDLCFVQGHWLIHCTPLETVRDGDCPGWENQNIWDWTAPPTLLPDVTGSWSKFQLSLSFLDSFLLFKCTNEAAAKESVMNQAAVVASQLTSVPSRCTCEWPIHLTYSCFLMTKYDLVSKISLP